MTSAEAQHEMRNRVSNGWFVLGAMAVAAVLVMVALFATMAVTGTSASAQAQGEPPPRLVILARSDVPADALASGPVGGVLGAPVLLTPQAGLHAAAADALVAIDPDMVVLAGGTAALSSEVEQAVADLGYPTRRAAGADRHETAVLVSALLAEFNTGRPVLTGSPVTDEVIPGLNAERLQGQTPDELVAGLQARVAALEATLAGVTREVVEGHDTIRFEGVNVQVVNGTGGTDGNPNGVGNLIIGYNAQPPATSAERTGSHYLVVGDQHEWTAHGGILAGLGNTASGPWATVTGGVFNTAEGFAASVTGGGANTAEGSGSSASGGNDSTASGNFASVTGGTANSATGISATVAGGRDNTASGQRASVSGGEGNAAGGSHGTVSGGRNNTASGERASILGGSSNQVTTDTIDAAISGGSFNAASGNRASVSGGLNNTASGNWASILGGENVTVSGNHGMHPN